MIKFSRPSIIASYYQEIEFVYEGELQDSLTDEEMKYLIENRKTIESTSSFDYSIEISNDSLFISEKQPKVNTEEQEPSLKKIGTYLYFNGKYIKKE